MTTKRTRTTKKMIKTGIRSDHGPIRAALSSAILGAYPVCQHPVQFWHLDIGETIVGRDKSEIKKARTHFLVYYSTPDSICFDFLREHLPDNVDDIKDGVRDTYDTASRRVSRATRRLFGATKSPDVFQHKSASLLIGVGIGVGVGLLIAPASGEKTRADISDKVSDLGSKVREQAGKKPPSATGTYGE